MKKSEEIRKYLEMNKNKNTTFQNLQHTGKAILRRKFRDTPRDKKKTSNKQPKLLIKRAKSKDSRRKEIVRITGNK